MQLHSPYVRRGCCDGCEGMDLLAAKAGRSGFESVEGSDGRAKTGGRAATGGQRREGGAATG
jgi:hypothetical protein